MAQTTVAASRQFLSSRLVTYTGHNVDQNKKSKQPTQLTLPPTHAGAHGTRWLTLSRLLDRTYAVFPSAIDWTFAAIQTPLPPIIVKYVQLNWAAAGFAKISPIVKCFSRQTNMDKFGEDAFFTLNAKRKDYIGVADGVGGWRTRGYDPSAFSASLMRICKDMAGKKSHDPLRLIDDSYNKLLLLNKRKNFRIIGSSTVCILSFDHATGMLTTANLGDSGYLISRDGKIIDRSERQTHTFNIPKQLAYAPPTLKHIADLPSDADEKKFICCPGDLIVTATDGLFDNVPDDLILDQLSRLPETDEIMTKDLEGAAKSLASLARSNARDQHYVSPFSIAARSAGFNHQGGKMDDVTVIVSLVSDLGTEV